MVRFGTQKGGNVSDAAPTTGGGGGGGEHQPLLDRDAPHDDKTNNNNTSGGGGVVYYDNPLNVDQDEYDDDEDYKQQQGNSHTGDHGGIDIPITPAVYLWSLCAALNSCNLGYDIGVNTSAGLLLQRSMNLSVGQIEFFMGSLNLFAMLGSIASPAVADRCGRRGGFLAAAACFILGLGVMSTSTTYGMLMVGRLFVGLGVGFGLYVNPMYISEISPACHRGYLVTWCEVAMNVGIVFGFCSGLIFEDRPANAAWRGMFALGAVLPVMVMILAGTGIMPESPRYLVSQGRTAEATQILQQIYPPGFDVEVIARDIRDGLERDERAEHAVGWSVLLHPTPAFRRMLVVGLGVSIFSQLVGIDAVQYFLVYILNESGVTDRTSQSWILVGLGLFKLAVIFVAGNLFDLYGRRPLFFASLTGMGAALAVLAVDFARGGVGGGESSSSPVVVIVCLAVYFCSFSMGVGPGAWLVPSEIFSTSIRSKAMSVTTFANRVSAAFMSSTVLTASRALGWDGYFGVLSAVCLAALVFLYEYLPETKGTSLEDMSTYFAELTNDRSFLELESSLSVREWKEGSTDDVVGGDNNNNNNNKHDGNDAKRRAAASYRRDEAVL